MTYAADTTVSPEKSQYEIKKVLTKYKASAFAFAESKEKAVIQFEMHNRRVKFVLPLTIPKKNSWDKISQNQIDQKIRTKWRCLLLVIKAKLESVESQITTFEEEFLAHILLPNGSTVGETVIPEIEASYQNKSMPLLLGMK